MKIQSIEAQRAQMLAGQREVFSGETEIAMESEFGVLGLDPDQISVGLDFTARNRVIRKVADIDFEALKANPYFWVICSHGINLKSWVKYSWRIIHWTDGTKTHCDPIRMGNENALAQRHGQPPEWREVA